MNGIREGRAAGGATGRADPLEVDRRHLIALQSTATLRRFTEAAIFNYVRYGLYVDPNYQDYEDLSTEAMRLGLWQLLWQWGKQRHCRRNARHLTLTPRIARFNPPRFPSPGAKTESITSPAPRTPGKRKEHIEEEHRSQPIGVANLAKRAVSGIKPQGGSSAVLAHIRRRGSV